MRSNIRICLVSPLPPPYGGIAHWTRMICNYAATRSDVDISIVDTAVRWRAEDDLVIWKRVVMGGWQLLRDINRVIGQLRKHPHIVHLTTSGQLAVIRDLTVMHLAHMYRVPVIYHIRCGRIPRIAAAGTLEWKLFSKALCIANMVIAIDISTEEAIRNHIPKAILTRVPNCIDTHLLPYSCGFASREKTLMFLGWTLPTKGVEELVDAWSQLDHLNWKLIVVGPGSKEYQDQLIAKYHPTDMEFTGEKPHDEAIKIMAECDLFILPSHTEGFPNVIVEAMALGKAIIATRVGAIPEMLRDGAGVLIEPQNVEELKSALQSMLADTDSRNQMGSRARKRAICEYSLDSVFERYMDIWKHVDKINRQMRILLVSPLPPPSGGIGTWTSTVVSESIIRKSITIHVVDTAVRWRAIDNLHPISRIVGGSLQMLRDLWRIWKAIRQFRPDVLHLNTHGQYATIRDLGMLRLARNLGIMTVIQYHMGRLPDIINSDVLEWKLIKRAMRQADRVVVFGKRSEQMVNKMLEKPKAVSIPNPVDIFHVEEIVAACCTPKSSRETLHIVFAGHVQVAKGATDLVEACCQLVSRNFVLDIVGPVKGKYKNELQILASSYEDGSWLVFHGAVSKDTTIQYISKGDILILPSHTEGFPIVAIEAMVCGKPIIATSVGAIPEILDLDGDPCGICVEPRDVDGLKNAIAALLDDPERRLNLAQRAKIRVQDYSSANVFAELTALWKSVIDKQVEED